MKNQGTQISELCETLDTLCKLVSRHEDLRQDVYSLENHVFQLANQLKTCEGTLRMELEHKLHETFWAVQSLLVQFKTIEFGLNEVQQLVTMICGVRDNASLGLSQLVDLTDSTNDNSS